MEEIMEHGYMNLVRLYKYKKQQQIHKLIYLLNVNLKISVIKYKYQV